MQTACLHSSKSKVSGEDRFCRAGENHACGCEGSPARFSFLKKAFTLDINRYARRRAQGASRRSDLAAKDGFITAAAGKPFSSQSGALAYEARLFLAVFMGLLAFGCFCATGLLVTSCHDYAHAKRQPAPANPIDFQSPNPDLPPQ